MVVCVLSVEQMANVALGVCACSPEAALGARLWSVADPAIERSLFTGQCIARLRFLAHRQAVFEHSGWIKRCMFMHTKTMTVMLTLLRGSICSTSTLT